MRTALGAGGQPIAFVRDELLLDEGVCILRSACSRRGLVIISHDCSARHVLSRMFFRMERLGSWTATSRSWSTIRRVTLLWRSF